MRTNPHILMCRPDFYGIEYEINAWMDKSRQADRDVAVSQWNDLKNILQHAGAKISEIEPVSGLPDMVFTANAALIHHQKAIVSRFRPVQRQPEEAFNASWFAEHGFEVTRMADDRYFEGVRATG